MKKTQLLQFAKEIESKRLTATFEDGIHLGVAYDFCMELGEFFREAIQKQQEESTKQGVKDGKWDEDKSKSGDSKE